MARAKITYEYNNTTGKRVIHVDYQSDPGALAHEHEAEHRRIVQELIGKGVISTDEAADVVVDRQSDKPQKRIPKPEERRANPARKAQEQ